MNLLEIFRETTRLKLHDMEAPQARNVRNRRIRNPRLGSPARAEQSLLFSSCISGYWCYVLPPVPLRSTDGYLRYAPAALTFEKL